MTIGIIGGAGFVGSGIRRAFEARGCTCRVIEKDNYGECIGSSYDVIVNANGNSKKYLAEQSPKEEFEASVLTVQQSLVDFRYGIYVYCSSVDVYPDHENILENSETAVIDPLKQSRYGFHKFCAEQIVRRYADRWLILRFAGFVGEGLRKNSIYDILHGVPLRVDIDSEYQYLPTESAGSILHELVTKPLVNETVNVCGDGCITLREVIARVPEYSVRYAVPNPPKERYEINIGKLRSLVKVPQTRESVGSFIAAGRVSRR